MKPLTVEETRLKEETKERCLAKGQYTDENAKAKFDMLCHLEDFEIQYWELLKENEKLKEELEETKKCLKDMYHINIENDKDLDKLKTQLEECKDKINWYENFEVNKTIDQLRLKHNIQQKEFIKYLEDEINSISCSKSLQLNGFDVESIVKPYRKVLQKYKKIIGYKDE